MRSSRRWSSGRWGKGYWGRVLGLGAVIRHRKGCRPICLGMRSSRRGRGNWREEKRKILGGTTNEKSWNCWKRPVRGWRRRWSGAKRRKEAKRRKGRRRKEERR